MMGARIRAFGLLAPVLACFAAAPAHASAPAARTFAVTLHPAPGDVALLAVRFPHAGHRTLAAGAVRVSVAGAFGADYLAVALPRRAAARGVPILVLVANRVTPLMDPFTVHLRVRVPAAFGAALTAERSDPLSLPSARAPRGLCSLTTAGAALAAGELRPVSSRGAPLTGLGAAGAVADGYDAACGLRYPLAFARAVRGPEASCPAGSGCAPGPEPVPVPPPEAPKCAPCNPQPGHACPLQEASAAICVAGEDATPRPVPAGGAASTH